MADVTRKPEHDVENVVVAFSITKPFVPHVLDEEVAAEQGWAKCDIAFEGDPAHASAEHPVTVWLPYEVNTSRLVRVLAEHEVPTPAIVEK